VLREMLLFCVVNDCWHGEDDFGFCEKIAVMMKGMRNEHESRSGGWLALKIDGDGLKWCGICENWVGLTWVSFKIVGPT
jgi:hypothetical protein